MNVMLSRGLARRCLLALVPTEEYLVQTSING